MPKPEYAQLDLPEAPADRPYVLMNMVMSIDGKAVVDGDEGGLGSDVDRHLMRQIRTNADVVLVGAGTLRATGASSRLGAQDLEQIRLDSGRPRFPTAALLTRSGDVPLDKIFFTARDFDAVVYVLDETPAERRKAIAATGRPVIELPVRHTLESMLAHMRTELDARVLLVEGGPETNGAFCEAGFVDELFVTVGPVVVGRKDTPTIIESARLLPSEPTCGMELVSATPHFETGEVLFLRYRRSHD